MLQCNYITSAFKVFLYYSNKTVGEHESSYILKSMTCGERVTTSCYVLLFMWVWLSYLNQLMTLPQILSIFFRVQSSWTDESFAHCISTLLTTTLCGFWFSHTSHSCLRFHNEVFTRVWSPNLEGKSPEFISPWGRVNSKIWITPSPSHLSNARSQLASSTHLRHSYSCSDSGMVCRRSVSV